MSLEIKMPTNVAEMDKTVLKAWIDTFDVCIFDCDGVLWAHDNLYEGAEKVLNEMISMGKQVYLVTNNSATTREDMLKKCLKMGFNVCIVSL